MNSETTVTRELTAKELSFMRRKHFVIIPVLSVVALFLWVVFWFEKLPEIARWAGAAIAIVAGSIFIVKHIKMERDLREGLVHTINGIITERRKFGRSRKKSSGGLRMSNSGNRSSAATYFIYIDGVKFNVPPKIYSKVKEGDKVEMNYFPKSQFYLGIHVIGG